MLFTPLQLFMAALGRLLCSFSCFKDEYSQSLYPGPCPWKSNYLQIVKSFNLNLVLGDSIFSHLEDFLAEYPSAHFRQERLDGRKRYPLE